MQLGHLAVTVKDMEKSIDFYTRVLGGKKAFEFANPANGNPWIVYIYIGSGQFIELFYDGTVDTPWRPELRGFNHLCLQVEDCRKTCEEIRAKGYTIDKEPKTSVDKNWQCWITDPDGIRVEIMSLDPDSPHMQFIKSQEGK